MPKMKTHKSTAKRIKITGTGKVMMGHGFQNKKRSAKSKRTLRKLHDMFPVSAGVKRRVRSRVPGIRVRSK